MEFSAESTKYSTVCPLRIFTRPDSRVSQVARPPPSIAMKETCRRNRPAWRHIRAAHTDTVSTHAKTAQRAMNHHEP